MCGGRRIAVGRDGNAALRRPSDRGSVLVVGATRGIGLALAAEYVAAGYRVNATARNDGTSSQLRALAAGGRVGGSGVGVGGGRVGGRGEAIMLPLDVTNTSQLALLV